MAKIDIEWCERRWYKATIDLDSEPYDGLTASDFPVRAELGERAHEVLSDLESTTASLFDVDAVEIRRVRSSD